jgi:uncharacterized protein YndB with AHSA1/START domain
MADGFTLELTRVLAATRADVFKAFSDSNVLRQWWGPRGFTVPSLDFDPLGRPGYRIRMQPPEGHAFSVHGEFREVEPPARLAFTFVWEPPGPDDVETLVELSFIDRGDSTEVWLTQGAFKTEARWELHRDGWNDGFEKLERMFGAG